MPNTSLIARNTRLNSAFEIAPSFVACAASLHTALVGVALACVVCPASVGAATPDASPPTMNNAPQTDLLGAVGIGVTDLSVSTAFYVDVLGMQELRTYHVGDLDEVVVGFPQSGSAAVVLMHWQNDARRYDGTNVKLVFSVADPADVLARIRAHGGKVEREATPIDVLNGRVVGLGRDPDNYLIELLKH